MLLFLFSFNLPEAQNISLFEQRKQQTTRQVCPIRQLCDSRFQTWVTCRLLRGCPLLDATRPRKTRPWLPVILFVIFVSCGKITGVTYEYFHRMLKHNLIYIHISFILYSKMPGNSTLLCKYVFKDYVNSYSFPKVDTQWRNIYSRTTYSQILCEITMQMNIYAQFRIIAQRTACAIKY